LAFPTAFFFATVSWFVFVSGTNLLTLRGIESLSQQASWVILIAVGIGLTMIAGEFDLSVGATALLGAVVSIKVGNQVTAIGPAVGLLAGAVVGLVNGSLIGIVRLNSLVVTLGTLVLVDGIANALLGGNSLALSNIDAALWVDRSIAGPFAPRFLITVILALIVWAVFRWSWFGVSIRALGSDRIAASRARFSEARTLVMVFVVSGAASGFAGSMLAYSVANVSPSFGSNILLSGASAAILGGISLTGGSGTPVNAMLGALIVVVLQAGLADMNLDSDTIRLLFGLVLAASIALYGRSGGSEALIAGLARLRPSVRSAHPSHNKEVLE